MRKAATALDAALTAALEAAADRASQRAQHVIMAAHLATAVHMRRVAEPTAARGRSVRSRPVSSITAAPATHTVAAGLARRGGRT